MSLSKLTWFFTNAKISVTATQTALYSALFFVVFFNFTFYKAVLGIVDYRTVKGLLFIANVSLVVWLLTFIVISLIALPYLLKPALAFLFFAAASAAYFMNTYGVVIHRTSIQSLVETDFSESMDLMSASFAVFVIVLGLIPSLLLFRLEVVYSHFSAELFRKVKMIVIAFAGCSALILCMSMDYASFFRNHKDIRQMVNPLNFIYAGLSYATTSTHAVAVSSYGEDAAVGGLGLAHKKPTLLILVVGETARADHFGINGYERDTTPLLGKQDIINFRKVTSCGTETAVSVPCMFSGFGRADYSDAKAKAREGLLDVISHAGIPVLWRDNNSSCKGTCERVSYEAMHHLQVPEFCNGRECFDEILLHQLDEQVASVTGSKVIVLHQKGSHGPDYFERYPQDKEFFQPVCKTNQLQDCTKDEVINGFDNTIRYTDYFLNKTIEWLKTKDGQFNTSLVYVSDHGESLGENKLYLHGMPYSIAPKEQKHVPMLMWFSAGYANDNRINRECLQGLTDSSYSHDNLFHTLLGMLDIQTRVYAADLDILNPCKQP